MRRPDRVTAMRLVFAAAAVMGAWPLAPMFRLAAAPPTADEALALRCSAAASAPPGASR